ncbi:MAG: hypothetical protein MI724_17220 [Spirochaetales bacterium]|nr:hypothetical protein [Spirochaetales bacterium]
MVTPPRPVRRGCVSASLPLVLAVAVATVLPRVAFAEVSAGVSVDVYNSIVIEEERSTSAGLGLAELDLRNAGGGDVRSRLVLRATLQEEDGEARTELTVPRAEIRWRLRTASDYTLRFSAGRTRISWGDGQLYNAGDVINGAAPEEVDLTDDTLRDETLWLLSAYLPLGRFAFFEPVVLFPMADEIESRDADEVASGGRVQAQILNVKTEAGYLYRGDGALHQPYLSVQGNLFLDWYIAASVEQPVDEEGDLSVSGGLLHTGTGPRLGTWTMRIETLWTAADERLLIYPEITWAPSQLISTFVRTQIVAVEEGRRSSIEDPAVLSTIGVSWTPRTALTLSVYGSVDTETELGTVTAAVGYVF